MRRVLLLLFVLLSLTASAAEDIDALLLNGYLQQAEEAIEAKLQKKKDDPTLLKKKALLLLRQKKEEELFAVMETIAKKSASDVELKKSLLGLAFKLGKDEKAAELLAELSKKERKNPQYTYALFGLYLKQSQFQKAVDLMTTYLKRNKTDTKAYYKLAYALMRNREYAKAKEALRSYKKELPQDAEGYLLEGHILEGLGDCRRAIVAYDTATQKGLPKAVVPLSICAAHQGQYQKLKDVYPQLIQFKESAPYLSFFQRKLFYKPRSSLSSDGYFQKENDIFRRWKGTLTARTSFSQAMEGMAFWEQGKIDHTSFGKKNYQRLGLGFYSVFYPLAFSLRGDEFILRGGKKHGEGAVQVSWTGGRTTLRVGGGREMITEGLQTFQTLQKEMSENHFYGDIIYQVKNRKTSLDLHIARTAFSDGNHRKSWRFTANLPLLDRPSLLFQFSLLNDEYDFSSPFYYSEPKVLTGDFALTVDHTFSQGTHVKSLFSIARLQTPGRRKESDYLEWILGVDHPLGDNFLIKFGYHGNSSPAFFYQIFQLGVEAFF